MDDQDGRDAEQEAHHQDMLNKERAAAEALQRCADAGANLKDLELLAREAGVRWKPERRA